MGRILRHDVHVTLRDNSVVVLPAGASVPAEYADYVTNPKAFVEVVDAPARASSSAGGDPTGSNYAEWSNSQLKAALKKRELPQGGKKAELVDRLKLDDAEHEEAGDGDESADGDESGDGDGDESDESDEDDEEDEE